MFEPSPSLRDPAARHAYAVRCDPRDRGQTAAINRLESNGNSGSHAPDLHATSPTGIPSRISNVRFDPLEVASPVRQQPDKPRHFLRRRFFVFLGEALREPAVF